MQRPANGTKVTWFLESAIERSGFFVVGHKPSPFSIAHFLSCVSGRTPRKGADRSFFTRSRRVFSTGVFRLIQLAAAFSSRFKNVFHQCRALTQEVIPFIRVANAHGRAKTQLDCLGQLARVAPESGVLVQQHLLGDDPRYLFNDYQKNIRRAWLFDGRPNLFAQLSDVHSRATKCCRT